MEGDRKSVIIVSNGLCTVGVQKMIKAHCKIAKPLKNAT